MAANGRLPASALAPIYGGRLRKDAARAWNAMAADIKRRSGVQLRPLGPNSSYRDYPGQVRAKRLYGSNAATPGSSNHGWGIAVDLATRQMRSLIDRYGARYGWAKKWSDASWEWWHLKWRAGVWKPTRRPDPYRSLTKRERRWAERLDYHQRERAREARTGKGKRYRRQDKWVGFWAKKVRRHMAALAKDAKKSGWKKDNRGARYQALKRSLNR